MRVLHLTTEFPPVIFGGLGTAVGGWVNASVRAGLSVAVELVEGPLVLREGELARYGEVPAGLWRPGDLAPRTVTSGGVTFLQTPWRPAVEAGLALLESWRPDVLHLHTAMLWQVGLELGARSGRPLVFHVHSVDRAEYEIGEEPNEWLAHSDQERVIAIADRLVALSRSEGDLLAGYYPEAASRVRVIGNGIDDSPPARAAVRDRERPRTRLTILYSGRLVERKGIRELLAAIPEVAAAVPETRFVITGGPPVLSPAQVRAMWMPPALEPYRDRVHFTGWLRPDAIARWYRDADVLVVPSRYEPFGMVLLEGMLVGLPIVACSVGGPAEILEDGRTALLVPPRDSGAIADALIRLATDAGLRLHLGRNAAHEVRRRWLWAGQVRKMRRLYEEVVPPRLAPFPPILSSGARARR